MQTEQEAGLFMDPGRLLLYGKLKFMKQLRMMADNISEVLDKLMLDAEAEAENARPLHDTVDPGKFSLYMNAALAGETIRQGREILYKEGKKKGICGVRAGDWITLIPMSEEERTDGGAQLVIKYMFYNTEFGRMLLASTMIGLCHMEFVNETDGGALRKLRSRFPAAAFLINSAYDHHKALAFISHDVKRFRPLCLHIDGTPFQVGVWRSLLNIPMGELASYKDVAGMIGKPSAARAVGSAVAGNPVAFLIPCHRVVRGTGEYGEYAWGSMRKAALIGWEANTVFGDGSNDPAI